MNSYNYVHCKKDFRGNIDIRSHIVKMAIEKGDNITVTCGSFPGKSVYTPEELKNPIKIQGPFPAKHGSVGEYYLHVYAWKFN